MCPPVGFCSQSLVTVTVYAELPILLKTLLFFRLLVFDWFFVLIFNYLSYLLHLFWTCCLWTNSFWPSAIHQVGLMLSSHPMIWFICLQYQYPLSYFLGQLFNTPIRDSSSSFILAIHVRLVIFCKPPRVGWCSRSTTDHVWSTQSMVKLAQIVRWTRFVVASKWGLFCFIDLDQ